MQDVCYMYILTYIVVMAHIVAQQSVSVAQW